MSQPETNGLSVIRTNVERLVIQNRRRLALNVGLTAISAILLVLVILLGARFSNVERVIDGQQVLLARQQEAADRNACRSARIDQWFGAVGNILVFSVEPEPDLTSEPALIETLRAATAPLNRLDKVCGTGVASDSAPKRDPEK